MMANEFNGSQKQRPKIRDRSKYSCGLIPAFGHSLDVTSQLHDLHNANSKDRIRRRARNMLSSVAGLPRSGKPRGTSELTTLHFLTLPVEIRFDIYDHLISKRRKIDIVQEAYEIDDFGELAKTCHKVRQELRAWKRTKPTLQASRMFGLYDPVTTVFFARIDRDFRTSQFKRIFQQFCDEEVHWKWVQHIEFEFKNGPKPEFLEETPSGIRFRHRENQFNVIKKLNRFHQLRKITATVNWIYKGSHHYSFTEVIVGIIAHQYPTEEVLRQRPPNYELPCFEVYDISLSQNDHPTQHRLKDLTASFKHNEKMEAFSFKILALA
ncbi:hypothetical protein PVAG01_05875 [Phlyctema vagabunda]|uniref:F-box domain-containing protein n=1 Tax=Phlyctema vagabunda TaxID=108571 RepID=A0ABR4PEG9_9HELO